MKFTAKEVKGNVNISHTPPIKEFFILLGGLVAIFLIIYVGMGFAVDVIAPRISVDFEKKLGGVFIRRLGDKDTTNEARDLEELFRGLVNRLPETGHEFSVQVVNSPRVNAFALPGGHVVVFRGLLDEVNSENELAFILGHELGHFIHRDHLRGLGRGLVLSVAVTFLFGSDNTLSQFITGTVSFAQMKFSQKQETAADLFALELINKHYGHTGGATDFFRRVIEKKEINKFRYFFSTHPDPDARVKAIEQEIRTNNYQIEETTAIDSLYVSSPGDSGAIQDSKH